MNARDELLKDDLSEAEVKGLSREELALWLTRPRKSEIVHAKSWMIVRVALLIVATIYYQYRYGGYAETTVLLFLLFCYEWAYYFLRKEKVQRDYAGAMQNYMQKLLQLPRR